MFSLSHSNNVCKNLPLTGQKHEKENILSLLTNKDFGSFRESVKREHVHTQFSDKMSLLHCTVVSRDADSVEHVLNLGADVNCKAAGGYTPLIIAVLQRFVLERASSLLGWNLCLLM